MTPQDAPDAVLLYFLIGYVLAFIAFIVGHIKKADIPASAYVVTIFCWPYTLALVLWRNFK